MTHLQAFRRLSTPLLLLACATLVLRLVVGGQAVLLVRPELLPFLVVAAAVLIGLAVVALVTPPAALPGPGPHQAGAPLAGWALLALVVAACLVRPGAVDTLIVANPPPTRPLPPASGRAYSVLPPGDPLRVPLDVYSERSLQGGGPTLAGRSLVLTGFVSHDPRSPDWVLARLRLRCCLADARPLVVRAVGAPTAPSSAWAEVHGTYVPATADGVPQIRVDAVVPIEPPDQPYLR